MAASVSIMTPVHGEIPIPNWVVDLESFRRWYHSGAVPEKLKVHFINGRVWVDDFMEEFFSHNQVKAAVSYALSRLAKEDRLGRYVPDGMLLRNTAADIATEPDAMFVLTRTLKAGKVTFTAGQKRGAQATEMVGTPDLVVEIVSPSSHDKDHEWVMSAYHNAGIPEYWLIDARADRVQFDIYKRGSKGYSKARHADGWVKSGVFGRSFRMVRTDGDDGDPDYILETR